MVLHLANVLSTRRNPRSSDMTLLVVPTSRLVTKGDRAFAVNAPSGTVCSEDLSKL